jgi:hypothetical protein
MIEALFLKKNANIFFKIGDNLQTYVVIVSVNLREMLGKLKIFRGKFFEKSFSLEIPQKKIVFEKSSTVHKFSDLCHQTFA